MPYVIDAVDRATLKTLPGFKLYSPPLLRALLKSEGGEGDKERGP